MKLRPVLVLWHRWFGLLAGAWLFVLAATGSVLVFYEEIDRASNPDLWRVEAAGERRPAGELVAAAEASRPGSYGSYVKFPAEATEPLVVFLSPRAGSGAPLEPIEPGLHVFVDPYTAEVLGERVFGAFRIDRRHLAHFLYQLHMDLHLGRYATMALGLLALLWVLDHLIAAWLSFPKLRRWRESFRVRRGARGAGLVYGLHRASGLWLLPITLMLAISGVYFDWYPQFVDAVDSVSPVTRRYYETAPVLDEPLFEPAVSLDRAITTARERAGGAAVDGASIFPGQGLYWLQLFDPRDLDSHGGRWIYVDMESGAVRSDRHAAEGSLGDRVIAWQYPLHSGKAFGWPGRIAIFLSGIAVCGLTATGFVLWAKKRRSRRSVRARRAAHAPVPGSPRGAPGTPRTPSTPHPSRP